MKKLLTSLTTFALVAGTVTSATAWTHPKNQNVGVANETAQDIATKLQGKTIQLYPGFWLGKNIKNYQAKLKNAIVQEKILTKTEVQYVSWGDLTVTGGVPYHNRDFTVAKDGQTVIASHITLDFRAQDPYRIALKLSKSTIKLDPSYWVGKNMINQKEQLQQAIVQQGLLTFAEAQYIQPTNLQVNQTKVYEDYQVLVYDGYFTQVISAVDLDVSTGAQKIAEKLANKTINLDPTFWIGKNIKTYHNDLAKAIVAQGILTQAEVQYVTWGDLTLNQARKYPKSTFTVSKNGYSAVANNIILDVQWEAGKIADKLSGRTVKLGPNFWLGQNLQANRQKFLDALVEQHIVTAAEAADISLPDLTIDQAKKYANLDFNISKNGHSAVAHNVTLDDEWEAEKIANKLANRNIRLGISFWLGVHLDDPKERRKFEDELIYRKIVTREEVQYVTWPDLYVTRAHLIFTNVKFTVLKNNHTAIAPNITLRFTW